MILQSQMQLIFVHIVAISSSLQAHLFPESNFGPKKKCAESLYNPEIAEVVLSPSLYDHITHATSH